MAATPYLTLDDVCRNLQFQCEVSVGLVGVSAVIEAYRLANTGFLSNPLSQDEIDGCLKKLTGCTAATGTDLNCYPRGYDIGICFDLEGNAIP